MATVFRDIWVNWLEKRLQQGLFNGGEFLLPDFHKYEECPFRIRLVAPDGSGIPESFSLIPISPFTLTVTINDTLDDATPLAAQSTWVQDTANNKFEGVLDLNTPAMNAYIAATVSGVAAYFQIEVSQAGGQPTPIYQRVIRILNSVTQPTITSPDVTKTYRTAEQSDGLYLGAIGKPGQWRTELSPSGNYSRTLGVDDGGAPVDIILPYPPIP